MAVILERQKYPRPLRVRRSVVEAMNNWARRSEPATEAPLEVKPVPSAEAILRSLPRREQSDTPKREIFRLPYIPSFGYKSNFWRSLRRLFTWLGVIGYLFFSSLGDRLLRRDTLERRAVRLRKTMERAGGTFVKIGQQAAMRIDLLSWVYCVELAKMLDTMTPFPLERALEAIERTIQRPWQDVFAVNDPVPIGSASIACVYQATLKDGTKVVVKVRRPGIGNCSWPTCRFWIGSPGWRNF